MGVIGRWLTRLVWLGAGVFALTLAGVWYADRVVRAETLLGRGLDAPVDAVIVLGAGIDGDGTLAFVSRRRATAAAQLIAEGQAGAAIFSGTLKKMYPPHSAGAMMQAHAIALGTPPALTVAEPRSRSTFENLRFSFAIADERGWQRLAIVSDAYHLSRAWALAAYLGRPEIEIVAARGFDWDWWPIKLAHRIREALAWWFNLAKIGAWEGLGLFGLSDETRQEWVW
ncbi:MAG: YdcF family protein [Pseudomonadota bacterium]